MLIKLIVCADSVLELISHRISVCLSVCGGIIKLWPEDFGVYKLAYRHTILLSSTNYIAKSSLSHSSTLSNTKLHPPSQTTLTLSCAKKPADVTSTPITTWNWIPLACSESPVTSVMSLIASTVRRCVIQLTSLSGIATQDVGIFVAGISLTVTSTLNGFLFKASGLERFRHYSIYIQ
jgi:hypothetical protein